MDTRRPARAAIRCRGLATQALLAMFSSAPSALAGEPSAPTQAPEGAENSIERVPDVQWDVGMVAGFCGVGNDDGLWESTRFCGALRGDALFGRERAASYGYGPYTSVGTVGFDDARFGLGGSLLVPVLEDFPLVLSLGGLARTSSEGTRPGAEAWLFWGARSVNFHGSYNLSNGLLLGAQRTFASEPESALWITAQLDAQWPLLPVMMLVGLFQGN